MRFETKHQYFKSLALKNKNFVNIGKSLSTRYQLLQSNELHMYALDKNVCATGLKAIAPAELNPCAQSLASDGQVWEVSSVKTSTEGYRKNDVLVMNKTTSLSFAEVSALHSTS